MENNPNYFANIPANVRYCKEISNGSKLLYGELTALTNKKGYCWASNGYFAELYGNSNKTISRWISELEQHDFITVIFVKQKDNTIQRFISIKKDVEIEDENVLPMDKNAAPYGQKCPTGMDKNGEYNITLNNTSNKEREEEEKKPKKTVSKKPALKPQQTEKDAPPQMFDDQSEMAGSSSFLWKERCKNNPELYAKLKNWAYQQILEGLPRVCKVYGKQYTDEQLQTWTEQQLIRETVNIQKTEFTMYGEPIECDTVKHMLNRANLQLRDKGGLDIATATVKQGRSKANNYQSPFK